MCVRSTPLGPADVLGRVRARRLQPDFSGKWYSDSPSRPGRIRGHGILFFLSLAHFRTLLVTEESGVTLLTCQRLSVATSPRARRSRRWDPSPSLHRTHYGLLDDGRARPTPWSSDLKLGSLNLTTLLHNRANAHPPSSQNAVAGIVEARPLRN